jgi:hypothetical protein
MLKRQLSDAEKVNINEDIYKGVNSTLKGNLKDLFANGLKLTTICVSLIWILHAVVYNGTLATSTLTMESLNGKSTNNGHDIIINNLIIAVPLFPCNFIGLLTELKIFGRLKIYYLSYGIATLFMISCWMLSDEFSLLYGISYSLMTIGNNINNSYASEVYPTKVRNIALGYLYFSSRVMAGIFQFVYLWIFDFGPLVPYYLSCGLMVILVLAIILLPYETHNQPLDKDFKNNGNI